MINSICVFMLLLFFLGIILIPIGAARNKSNAEKEEEDRAQEQWLSLYSRKKKDRRGGLYDKGKSHRSI